MTRSTIPDRNCPAPTRAEAVDFASLGDRPATQWQRRVICYCKPQACKDAAQSKRDSARALPVQKDPNAPLTRFSGA